MNIHTYFDRTYVINLDREPQKMARMRRILRQLHINYERVPAVDGQSMKAATYWRQSLARPKPNTYDFDGCSTLSPRSMACTLSHASVLRKAMAKKYKRILIFEDDVFLHRDFKREFQKAKDLPDWKILYLGCTDYGHQNIKPVGGFYHPDKAYGRFAYGVDSSIFEELVDLWLGFHTTGDTYLGRVIQPKYRDQIFAFWPHIVVADVTSSNIRPGKTQAAEAARAGWDMSQYNLE